MFEQMQIVRGAAWRSVDWRVRRRGILTVIASLHYGPSSLFTKHPESDKDEGGREAGKEGAQARDREKNNRFGGDPNWDVSSFRSLFYSSIYSFHI